MSGMNNNDLQGLNKAAAFLHFVRQKGNGGGLKSPLKSAVFAA